MKKQKVVITGSLGYLGTELCRLYSGESRYKDIVAIDNRFVSERVKQLRDWGIDFVHANILDDDQMAKVLKDADIIYHLAGITNVAYTKTQSNDVNDNAIREIGTEGTRKIINHSGNAKIIFPSSHVVFAGRCDTEFDITEDRLLSADLAYAQSKAQSEADLNMGTKNYIIVRLGSVYGYSTDTMRINIMPNLFSKITSQNGIISLYSGGVQHKSLVALLDVVRAMKFLAESDIKRETFHLSNENMTIKEVANICQKYNPTVLVEETDDEIPNLGYTLSNKKLLATGFKFLYNIDTCIEEMIKNWSAKEQPRELEYIQKGGNGYFDDRGSILNYELTEPINLIGHIKSKQGTVRANHYHPIQEQKCLLVKGMYLSVIRDLALPDAPLEIRVIRPGDMAIIRPNVAHAMVFLQDSEFLNLVRGEREHENYGITHTLPYTVVDEAMRQDLLNNYKFSCRCCRNTELLPVVDLGMSPLANNLTNSAEEKAEMYPLQVMYCPNCHNCQLSYVVPPEKMFNNYLYASSTAASFREHFENAAHQYVRDFHLSGHSFVVDIGSNDGVFLKPLQQHGVKVLGVEPAKNIADIALSNGVPTANAFFSNAVAHEIVTQYGKADIVTASNVFAHADKLAEMARQVFAMLKKDGVFIIEVQYFMDTIKDLTFDNIYHEHTQYWTVTSLVSFFKNLRMCLYKVEHIDTHGGSIRCYIRKGGEPEQSVALFMQIEQDLGAKDYAMYKEFGARVGAVKERVRTNFMELKNTYKKIAAYGSPAKATTALNYFGIDNSIIEYTIEDNALKHGKFIPGVNILIVSREYAMENRPDVIVVLAWNFFDEIKKNNQELINRGVKFISIKDLQL